MEWNDWALWHRERTDNGRRLTLFRCPLFGVHVNWIEWHNDLLHDHPWPYVDCVVSGAYTEVAGTPTYDHLGSTHYDMVSFMTARPAKRVHAIVATNGAVVLTFSGPGRKKQRFFEQLGQISPDADIRIIQRRT